MAFLQMKTLTHRILAPDRPRCIRYADITLEPAIYSRIDMDLEIRHDLMTEPQSSISYTLVDTDNYYRLGTTWKDNVRVDSLLFPEHIRPVHRSATGLRSPNHLLGLSPQFKAEKL